MIKKKEVKIPQQFQSNCKTCSCSPSWHTSKNTSCLNYQHRDNDYLGRIGRTNRCTCLKYIPSDNLEYLEWCYERKSKTSSL